MRAGWLIGLVGPCALGGVFGGACAGRDDQVMRPVVLGMVDTAPPILDDGETQVFQVTTPVALPLRRPSADEVPKGNADPYPRPPFYDAHDLRTTVRFTLSNLDDQQHTVELLIDPWNEFVRYVPGVASTRGGTLMTPNLSGIDRFFVLPPLGRVQGILPPDDLLELAIDLGTAMALERHPPAGDAFGGPALYNRAFNVQNRSTEPDPVLERFIPPVAAGVVGFALGLRTNERAKVAVEIVVDVQDLVGGRIVDDTSSQAQSPVGRPGKTLTPPAAPAAP